MDSWNGAPLGPLPEATMQMATDTSHFGWGAVLNGQYAHGQWTPKMSQQHSNLHELEAVHRALQNVHGQLQDGVVQILTDNVTTVAYLNNPGGLSQEFNDIVKQIWLFCQ